MKIQVIRRPIQVYKIDVFCPECGKVMLHNSVGQAICSHCQVTYKIEAVEGYREMQDEEPECFDIEGTEMDRADLQARGIKVNPAGEPG